MEIVFSFSDDSGVVKSSGEQRKSYLIAFSTGNRLLRYSGVNVFMKGRESVQVLFPAFHPFC